MLVYCMPFSKLKVSGISQSSKVPSSSSSRVSASASNFAKMPPLVRQFFKMIV